MKKFAAIVITVMVGLGPAIGVLDVSEQTRATAIELPDEKRAAIVDKCDSIKGNLVALQHDDSRVRVYLGRRYELLLSNYLTPLNVRLVENNLSTVGFIENQNTFVATRDNFMVDYIEYQKALEELVGADCAAEPVKFYDKLVAVRAKRKVVADDVEKLRRLTLNQVELVTKLMGEI